MTSPKFPCHLETRLNPHLTAPILGSEEHSVNIPPPIVAQGESSRKHPTNSKSMSISFEDEEDIPEATLEAGLMKDLKSQEIVHLREVVSQLHREVAHYRSTSDFYQGEAEHTKGALSLVKRKLTGAVELIHIRELALT
ncbi:hypothetical protein AMTR_s00028p00038190 [Amborella trichopoda]|uniref:Uncharacterized protein n=1 Tax=Amborella trichopoda TaxID=13333 RepID=W1PS64_AMBTC|nr:hypothetical protein AMTR_s00028p00038190 [Amborella trichopoda]